MTDAGTKKVRAGNIRRAQARENAELRERPAQLEPALGQARGQEEAP